MQSEHPDDSTPAVKTGFFHGRRPGPLISSLSGVVIVAVLLRLLESSMPILHDVLIPVYWIIGGIFLVVIARWLRGRRENRRATDRRKPGSRDVVP